GGKLAACRAIRKTVVSKPMEETNPYVPPREADAPLLRPGEWRVGDGGLDIRDGARLPEIDVFSGRDDVPLTPAAARFRVGGGRSGLIRWMVGTAVLVFCIRWAGLDLDLPMLLALVVIV